MNGYASSKSCSFPGETLREDGAAAKKRPKVFSGTKQHSVP